MLADEFSVAGLMVVELKSGDAGNQRLQKRLALDERKTGGIASVQVQEIEGEVIEVAKAGGQNYYVIEQDGERLAVPAGEKPEHEKGDEITATRTPEGFETGEAYGYGR